MSKWKRPPLDPDTAYVFRKIDEMFDPNKPKPSQWKESQERAQPKPIVVRPEPQLLYETQYEEQEDYEELDEDEQEEVEQEADGQEATSAPEAGAAVPQPQDLPFPDADLLTLVKLWRFLNARDRRELRLFAQVKYMMAQQDSEANK